MKCKYCNGEVNDKGICKACLMPQDIKEEK